MKTNKYLKISSVIQIISSIITLFFLDKFVADTIKSYKELYEATNNKGLLDSIALYEANGKFLFLAFLIITVIINIIILYGTLRKKEKINYKVILILSIVIFLVSDISINLWLSIINIIVCIKEIRKKRPVDTSQDSDSIKSKLPKYNMLDKLGAIVSIVAFFGLSKIIGLLPWGYITLSIILDVTMFIICIFVFWKELTIGFKAVKKNLKKFISYVFNNQVRMFGLYLAVSIIVSAIMNGDSQSVNQELAENLPLLYIVPSSILYAPLVEELIFRGSLRRIIKNDTLFIIMSGLFFGIMHTFYELTLFKMIILSIPYATLGAYLAYLYVKTNNILTPISCHLIHNTIACLFLLFL